MATSQTQAPGKRPPMVKLPTWESVVSVILLMVVLWMVYSRYEGRFGLYWTEHISFFVLQTRGVQALMDLWAGQGRPVGAGHMMVMFNELPTAHFRIYQIMFINAIIIHRFVRLLFPKIQVVSTLMAVLYLLSPLVWMSVHITGITVETTLMYSLLSIYLSYVTIRPRRKYLRWFALVGSLVTIPLYLFMFEVAIAIEVIRPFVIYRAMQQNAQQHDDVTLRPPRVALFSAIWTVPAIVLAIYRFFIFQPTSPFDAFTRPTPLSLGSIPVVLLQGFQGIFSGTVMVWPGLVEVDQINLVAPWLPYLLAALVGIYIVFAQARTMTIPADYRRVGISLLVVGFALAYVSYVIIAALTGSVNIAVTEETTRIQVVAQIGVIALWLGVLFLIGSFVSRYRYVYTVVLVIAIAPMIYLSSIARFTYHELYSDAWFKGRTFLWRLEEIVPDLRDGTVLVIDAQQKPIVDVDPSVNIMFNSLTAALFYDNPTVRIIDADRTEVLDGINLPYLNYDTFPDYDQAALSDIILIHEDGFNCIYMLDPTVPLPVDVEIDPKLRSLLLLTEEIPERQILDPGSVSRDNRVRYYPQIIDFEITCDENPEPAELSVMMIDVYERNIPVIIADPIGRLNIQIPNLLLDEVPTTSFYHIIEQEFQGGFSNYIDPNKWYPPEQTVEMLRAMDNTPSLWIVSREDAPPVENALETLLLDLGYIATELTEYREELFETRFVLKRYERLTQRRDRFQYEDRAQLLSFVNVPARVEACQPMVVKSFWTIDAPMTEPISATAHLIDLYGNTVSSSDGLIGYIPSSEWEPGEVYFDEREIVIPCEAAGQIFVVSYTVSDTPESEPLSVTLDGRTLNTDMPSVTFVNVVPPVTGGEPGAVPAPETAPQVDTAPEAASTEEASAP